MQIAIGTYISIITLNVNRLTLQPKDTDWLNGYKKNTNIHDVYKKPISELKSLLIKVKEESEKLA